MTRLATARQRRHMAHQAFCQATPGTDASSRAWKEFQAAAADVVALEALHAIAPAPAPAPVPRPRPAPPPPRPAQQWNVVHGYDANGQPFSALEADDDDDDEEIDLDDDEDDDPDGDDPDGGDDDEPAKPAERKPVKKTAQQKATEEMSTNKARALTSKEDDTNPYRPFHVPMGAEPTADELEAAEYDLAAAKKKALAPRGIRR